jgi:hypothetical protein
MKQRWVRTAWEWQPWAVNCWHKSNCETEVLKENSQMSLLLLMVLCNVFKLSCWHFIKYNHSMFIEIQTTQLLVETKTPEIPAVFWRLAWFWSQTSHKRKVSAPYSLQIASVYYIIFDLDIFRLLGLQYISVHITNEFLASLYSLHFENSISNSFGWFYHKNICMDWIN